jgi:putative acetyltransferase
MFTVHRASTGADWREATALLYDYVESVRGWTGVDPIAEQPQLHTELASPADHYATDDAVLYLAAWRAIAVGVVAIRVQPDGSAELKRMYVRPVARGRGHR